MTPCEVEAYNQGIEDAARVADRFADPLVIAQKVPLSEPIAVAQMFRVTAQVIREKKKS